METTLAVTVAVMLTVVVALWSFWARRRTYWRRHGVPSLPAEPFFGNTRDRLLMRASAGDVFARFYRLLAPHPFGGVLQTVVPTLVLRHPDVIKQVLVKDFASFEERGVPVDERRNPLSAHLFSLDGPRWRRLRHKLTPAFTSGKMKMMFRLMRECALELRALLEAPARRGDALEVKDVVGKFTTDVIGTCAFGLQFNSLRDPDSAFRRMGKAVFEPTKWQGVRQALQVALPSVAKRVLSTAFPPKHVSDFFLNAVKETVAYREKNNVKRNDFMQLLIELRNKAQLLDEYEKETTPAPNGRVSDEQHKNDDSKDDGDVELTDTLLAAQAFVFFIAGYETSATTMGFALHELAINPDVQDKLRTEIDAVLRSHGGEFSYECLQEMEYLDRVVQETLRKYPPLPVLARRCTMPYKIPGTEVTIEQGTRVVIPILGLHMDPKYFPEPARFDPDRFTEQNKAARPRYVYMPFGEGPRNCIGMRFGQLQTKLGLAALLHDFRFSPCSLTEREVTFDPRTIFTASKEGNWLRVSSRM